MPRVCPWINVDSSEGRRVNIEKWKKRNRLVREVFTIDIKNKLILLGKLRKIEINILFISRFKPMTPYQLSIIAQG